MARVFNSYPRNDGNEAAARLETALRDRGFGAWRDVRDIERILTRSTRRCRAVARGARK